MRTIDADRLIYELKRTPEISTIGSIISLIDRMPTVFTGQTCHVGDELELNDGHRFVITNISNTGVVSLMDSYGRVSTIDLEDLPMNSHRLFTGRHFYDLETLLDSMKGEI